MKGWRIPVARASHKRSGPLLEAWCGILHFPRLGWTEKVPLIVSPRSTMGIERSLT